MSQFQYDLIVIGTGPGGKGAAMQAGKNGLKVGVIERMEKIGGGCTHFGTIPSKALRYSIFKMTDVNSDPIFQAAGISLDLSIPELRKSAASVIRLQEEMRRNFYEKNDVAIHRGTARFVDANTLEISEAKGASEQLTAKNFVIAVGARPYRPQDVDF